MQGLGHALSDLPDIHYTQRYHCIPIPPSLHAGSLASQLVAHTLGAAAQLAAQAAKSFFMPLSVTALAMLARIQVRCAGIVPTAHTFGWCTWVVSRTHAWVVYCTRFAAPGIS